ncbi:MAG TPA: hypothetical protein VGR35_16555 [Tepidisphaeraceae bacterium]|nr:hypothetical protein [Tepidisphaeraceae bacterium]
MPRLNQIGVPPPGRSIHKRRAQLDVATAAGGEEPAADLSKQLVLSIVVFGGVLLAGVMLAWLVLYVL